MAITIKDMAKALGFSVSTISKALHDSYEISVETRELIKEYARVHNYRPNRLARGLKDGQSNTVGVIVSSFASSTFLGQIIDGVSKASLELGYDIIIMQSRESEESEKNCLDSLISKGVDGILIAPVSETSNSDYLNSLNDTVCPIVVFDRINPGIRTVKVGVNENNGVLEAIQHLSSIKRKRILFITGDKFGNENQRIIGYKKALKGLDIPFNPRYMVRCNLGNVEELDATISNALTELKEANIYPNAILGATDVITLRTLGVLASMNIKVPEEIAVIGFSNTDIAGSLNPALSTIRQPAKEMGFLSVQKLVELIHLKSKGSKNINETLLLDTSMQIRKSTEVN